MERIIRVSIVLTIMTISSLIAILIVVACLLFASAQS